MPSKGRARDHSWRSLTAGARHTYTSANRTPNAAVELFACQKVAVAGVKPPGPWILLPFRISPITPKSPRTSHLISHLYTFFSPQEEQVRITHEMWNVVCMSICELVPCKNFGESSTEHHVDVSAISINRGFLILGCKITGMCGLVVFCEDVTAIYHRHRHPALDQANGVPTPHANFSPAC